MAWPLTHGPAIRQERRQATYSAAGHGFTERALAGSRGPWRRRGAKRLTQGVYGERKAPIVQEWLATKEREREAAATHRREERDETALELAREANTIAAEANAISRRSNVIAWCALGAALLGVLISAATWWLGGE